MRSENKPQEHLEPLNTAIGADKTAEELAAESGVAAEPDTAASELETPPELDAFEELDDTAEFEILSAPDATGEPDAASGSDDPAELDNAAEFEALSALDATTEPDAASGPDDPAEPDDTSATDAMSELDVALELQLLEEIHARAELDNAAELEALSAPDATGELDASTEPDDAPEPDTPLASDSTPEPDPIAQAGPASELDDTSARPLADEFANVDADSYVTPILPFEPDDTPEPEPEPAPAHLSNPEPKPEPEDNPYDLLDTDPSMKPLDLAQPEPEPEPQPDSFATQTQGSELAIVPVAAPGRNQMPVVNRPGAETSTGSTANLSWGARSDVGLVRSHNEDAFHAEAPLFVVCDGMGGHAAGEVASRIAVEAIARRAPAHADEILLGAAVEAANEEVIEGALTGKGKPGMGCTASCVLVENNLMSIAHVGDSRVYLLHGGTLVRITRDHSYVEELVDAGEITADEARVHPSRSIITRALGSDPDMYADHFTLDVTSGDRIIVCSDGLSSMVPDKEIEELAVSSVTPQAAADTLVSAALTAGGHDNVTVVVVDVVDDGLGELHKAERRRSVLIWAAIAIAAIALASGIMIGLARNSWYVGNNNGTVGVFRGINDELFGLPLYELVESSSVQVSDLTDALQHQLEDGIGVSSMDEGCATVEKYRDQIEADKIRAAQTSEAAQGAAGTGKQGSQGAAAESGDSTPPAAAQTGQQAADDANATALQEVSQADVGGGGE